MVLDDGKTRLALVAVDVIGMFHPTVIDIREMIPAEAGITYLAIVATHTHEAPDMLGLWGESPLKSGVNQEWKAYVKNRIVQSVVEAVESMRPAKLRFSQNLMEGLVTLKDTREPEVYDPGLRMLQVVDAENEQTLGTLIQWANHPETLWSHNLLISSDFPHYLREAVEKGVYKGDSLVAEGVGGVAVYVNGAVGGLMTTHASTGVKDPFKDTIYVEPSYDKIRAQGDTLGLIILRTMKENPVEVRESGISLKAKTFTLPLDNSIFRLASAIGLMDADMTGWMKKRTEAAVWNIGPATFLTIPGELYPEILNGGVEALPGRDFKVDPQEVPPLRELMKGEFRFAIGLANDEIGYIIPQSQWDAKAPFVYRDKAYYGEDNSLGPKTAPILYRELADLIETLHFVSVPEVRDQVIERLIKQVPASGLASLDNAFILNLITPEEKKVFASNHWRFRVDKPALVSVMRHKGQEIIPFWLIEEGFENTGKSVKNENYDYEVWQKQYPAGEVRLGINGFDLHKVVYFVAVGPVENGKMPVIDRLYPDQWPISEMRKGAYTYNDWDELVIQELPDNMVGHTLLTTIRGRAREAAITGSFRTTEYPSSPLPDQIVLTWSGAPSSTQSVQWRTDTKVTGAYIKYWIDGTDEKTAREQTASSFTLEDVYIYNDMRVKHWEVNLESLKPGTKYNYYVGGKQPETKSSVYSFRTAPATIAPFKFIFLGDTHNEDIVKPVMEQAYTTHPDAAFLIHSGDHVNTGLFRDLWDKYFALGKEVFPHLTFVPTLGNHDSQDGLAPVLYTRLFMLPQEKRCGLDAERNYSFTYSNTRFFMIDATGDTDNIACWLEEELKKTTETWKIAVTLFPPYAAEDSYLDIRKKWCSLFDTYHVDLVLSGHIHQYFRSYPIYKNEVVESSAKGTIYVSSLTVETREKEAPSAKYNKLYANQGGLYQIIEIDSDKLSFISKSKNGEVIDHFQIVKP
jgi:predicted phosphodiesterase